MEKLACIKKVEQAKAEADRLAAAAGHYFHFSHCVPLFLYHCFFLNPFLFYYYLLICGSLFPTFPQFSSILHYEANPKPQTLNPISHYFLLLSSVSQRSSTMKEIYQGTDF